LEETIISIKKISSGIKGQYNLYNNEDVNAAEKNNYF